MRDGQDARPRAGHREQVQQRAGEQPRDERGVLHGVPAPETAPAEHFVRPVSADEDARAEEAPGDERKASRRAEPAGGRRARQKSACRAGERHGEQRIAEEQDRRMNRHPRVHEQGIHARAIGRDGLCELERALCECQHGQHGLEQQEDGERGIFHGAAVICAGAAPAQEHERGRRVECEPEQERALLTRPERRDFIEQRQALRRVAHDIGDFEMVAEEQCKEHGGGAEGGERREQGSEARNPAPAVTADGREAREQRRAEREGEQQFAAGRECRRHPASLFSFSYFDGHLIRSLSAWNAVPS